jgi:uncharacterized protein involved in exopolysaccharide biosynthesis
MDHRPEDIAKHLVSYWRTILAFAAFGAAAALGYSLAVPVSYTSTATILVRPTQLFEIRQSENVIPPVEQERKINSLAAILRGEHIIQEAVSTIGSDQFQSEAVGLRFSERFWELRQRLDPDGQNFRPHEMSAESKASRAAANSLHVNVEPKTNLISVSFNHRDPQKAALFVNTLLSAARKRISEQGARDGAASFLADQMKSYNEAYEKSLARLAEFSTRKSVYGLDDQRQIKLQREGELLAASQQTSSAIVERKKQAAELSRLLETSFPVAKYPQMNELLKLGREDGGIRTSTRSRVDLEDTRAPLLLVRVYQDTAQTLVKLHSEVAGLVAQYDQQVKDIEGARQDLGEFARNSATFELMQLEASQARQAAEQYKSFAIKEQVMAEAHRYGLSPMFEIVHAALPPREPSFPKPFLIVVFGLVAGVALGLVTAVTRLKWSPNEKAASSNGSRRRDPLRYIKALPTAAPRSASQA